MPASRRRREMSDEIKPYVPPGKILPEFTFQAVALGLLLSVIMCAANMYVGLKAGMTVSAAIPASVISMGILRGLMKRGTILENNIVHTIASSGESLAAGIIFTVPALVVAGLWTEFKFWETTLIALSGGLMGVTMMIPLRRAMIIEQKELKYPEGVACAEVLKAGDRGGAEMKGIFSALGFGALFKALQSIVGVFVGTAETAFRAGKAVVMVGTDVSPMLMAVGFIVGWEISLLIFLGGAISHLVAIPLLSMGMDQGDQSNLDFAWAVWDEKIRYFGIGAMVIAGIYSILKVGASIAAGIKTAIHGIRHGEDPDALRTDRSISGKTLISLFLVALVASAVVDYLMTGSLLTTSVTAPVMFVLAFFFVAVASYIVGLVGSSNSPVSGMTICTVLVTAGLLLLLGYTGTSGMLATLGVAGVVCCAACTSGDICQDLKIGQIVGATPKKLQLGEVLGTIIPAFIIAPILSLLHHAYGIGTPAREGVDALKAPQANLFAKLTEGLFGTGEIGWTMVGWGAAVGVLAIVIDTWVLEPRKTKFRLYAMPLAVGMYLPWTVTFPMLFGGFIYQLVEKRSAKAGLSEAEKQKVIHRGLLFGSGLVAGEAIMGILVAVLLVMNMKVPGLTAWRNLSGGRPVELVSMGAFVGMMYLLYRKASKSPDAG
ncbi:MAG TPA: oligopeptide transporter, OPT family [Planctomycetes bacterium]|nr:oligopeptide transporter, OPT family [Planctomycetota bacterium]